jgi:ATP-dependent Lon protease
MASSCRRSSTPCRCSRACRRCSRCWQKEREVAELRGKITEQVNEKVSTQQREFFLREQMKVIQKELGISKDDRTSDAERFRERLEALTLPGGGAGAHR